MGRRKGSKNKAKKVDFVKIRNNTNRKLILYIGNPNEEEPTAVVNLGIGEDYDFENSMREEISIQEERKEIAENRKHETAIDNRHDIDLETARAEGL